MATTEERLLTYLVNSKNGEQLPVLVNVQGSEFFIIYNPSTDRFEKVLISTLLTDDLIIDALGYTPEDIANKATDFTVKNDDLYPSTKSVDDFITFLKSNPNGLASTDSDGKIPANLLPPIAITSVIPVTETTIADFAANSGSYTFEQGDVLILDNGNGSYYMYNGGTKTDVSAYNEITASGVDWSQITNIPADVSNPTLNSVLNNGNSSSKNMVLDTDIFGAGLEISNDNPNSTSSAIKVTSASGSTGIEIDNTDGIGMKLTNTSGQDGVNITHSSLSSFGINISNSGAGGINITNTSENRQGIKVYTSGGSAEGIEAYTVGGANSSAILARATSSGTALNIKASGATSTGIVVESSAAHVTNCILVKKAGGDTLFAVDSEGNTTTQQLKIEDVSEDLTAPKIAVLDNDGNVGSISTDNIVILDDKKVVPSNNWDALDKTGYYTNTANNIPTLPENVDGLFVMHLDNGINASQTAYRVGELKMWIRKKSSSVWSDWEEVYHTGNLIPNRTIDSATTQTSTSLNSAFPVASNPVGTTVTNINALQLFMYVRISELLWRVITLGSTI